MSFRNPVLPLVFDNLVTVVSGATTSTQTLIPAPGPGLAIALGVLRISGWSRSTTGPGNGDGSINQLGGARYLEVPYSTPAANVTGVADGSIDMKGFVMPANKALSCNLPGTDSLSAFWATAYYTIVVV